MTPSELNAMSNEVEIKEIQIDNDEVIEAAEAILGFLIEKKIGKFQSACAMHQILQTLEEEGIIVHVKKESTNNLH